MERRRFLASLFGVSFAAPWLESALRVAAEDLHPHHPLALPTADQLAWQDLEFGMFVHIAPNTWQGVEQDNLSTPLSQINPQQLNTDQWAATAVALGAKYIVFVAKHSGGFCMWQTQTTDYGIRNTPWRGGRGDVVAEVAASCRKYGLKLGVYVSPRDASQGADTGGRCKTQALQEKYNALYRKQLAEVLSRYGEMVEIWFDGSSVVPVGDILLTYAPHAMIFQGPHATIRWTGNEDGFAPYPAWNAISAADAATGIATALNSDPRGSIWLPNEVDVSILRPNWFWSAQGQRNLLSLDALLEIYYRSVGRGAQLLLNLPPDRTGLLPEADCVRAKQFGDEIRRRFSRCVAETHGNGATIPLPLKAGTRFDTVILQEDCSLGERVRSYRMEARSATGWTTVATGSAIGHKRIQPVPSTVADEVRLVVTDAAAPPVIRRLAVFETGSAPPANWNAPATVWAFDKVGTWSRHLFNLDLSGRIHDAAQYRLRFVPEGGWGRCQERFDDAVLLMDDLQQPKLLRRAGESSDALILTIPGLGQKIVVQGRVACAESGSILMQKL